MELDRAAAGADRGRFGGQRHERDPGAGRLCGDDAARGEDGARLSRRGVGRVAQAVDADLLARAIAWSGESEKARNGIFNVTNGDVFVWPNVWPAIADALGFEAGVHVPLRLDTQIRSREDEWAAIRKAHGLRSGTLRATMISYRTDCSQLSLILAIRTARCGNMQTDGPQ